MKKSLPKPANWQDFENLCKKLFGEIWNCKNTIRKNGRSGQKQAGVDVYAIPKGELGYFGIQCKGKDDYTEAKVTEKEALAEIVKAADFAPSLKVFIIATTANKDAGLEAFIRKEDLKSRQADRFEIQFYSWEDLADLIEENRETYLWYMEGRHFRVNYHFSVLVDGQPEATVHPVYHRRTTVYTTKQQQEQWENSSMGRMAAISAKFTRYMPIQNPGQFNYAYCPLHFQLLNTGSMVLEDWKFSLDFDSRQVKEINDDYDGEPGSYQVNFIKALQVSEFPLTINKKSLTLQYKPARNQPLIQHDKRDFKLWLLPASHDIGQIEIKWEFLARDYNTSGIIRILVKPELERAYKQVLLEDGEEPADEEIIIVEKIADKTGE